MIRIDQQHATTFRINHLTKSIRLTPPAAATAADRSAAAAATTAKQCQQSNTSSDLRRLFALTVRSADQSMAAALTID